MVPSTSEIGDNAEIGGKTEIADDELFPEDLGGHDESVQPTQATLGQDLGSTAADLVSTAHGTVLDASLDISNTPTFLGNLQSADATISVESSNPGPNDAAIGTTQQPPLGSEDIQYSPDSQDAGQTETANVHAEPPREDALATSPIKGGEVSVSPASGDTAVDPPTAPSVGGNEQQLGAESDDVRAAASITTLPPEVAKRIAENRAKALAKKKAAAEQQQQPQPAIPAATTQSRPEATADDPSAGPQLGGTQAEAQQQQPEPAIPAATIQSRPEATADDPSAGPQLGGTQPVTQAEVPVETPKSPKTPLESPNSPRASTPLRKLRSHTALSEPDLLERITKQGGFKVFVTDGLDRRMEFLHLTVQHFLSRAWDEGF